MHRFFHWPGVDEWSWSDKGCFGCSQVTECLHDCRWSGVDRAERARRRHGDEGPVQDDDNPCPSVIDPITLEPVVTPAISPYGHVMGLATWNAVLAEQGKCPFTQQPLRRDQVGLLLSVHALQDKPSECFCNPPQFLAAARGKSH